MKYRIYVLALSVIVALNLTACKNRYDGIYKATFDCTDDISDGLISGLGTNVALDGQIEAEFTLTLKDGEYYLTLDEESFENSINQFLSNNIEAIICSILETDDKESLDNYANELGYSNYTVMKEQIVEEVMSDYDDDDVSFTLSGQYMISDDRILFKENGIRVSECDINDCIITVAVEDYDGVFGGEVISLEFVPCEKTD